MATAGDQSWNQQQQLGMQAANQAQSQALARLQGGMQSGQMADQGQLQRLQAQYGMGNQANDQNLQRAQFGFQMGQQTDQGDLARMQALMQGGSAADVSRRAGLNDYFAQAGIVDQRQKDQLAQLFGINGAQAGLYGGFYGMGGQLSGGMYEGGLNALTNSYGLNAQGAAAQAGQGAGTIADLTAAWDLYKRTNPGGGGGLGANPVRPDLMTPTKF